MLLKKEPVGLPHEKYLIDNKEHDMIRGREEGKKEGRE